jgi:hypothetical protein
MLEVNLSQHVAVPFNHGWMAAAAVLLSSLMVYLQLLREVHTILCRCFVYFSLIKTSNLVLLLNAFETYFCRTRQEGQAL